MLATALTLAALSFLAPPAAAECLDAARVEKEIQKDFTFAAPEGEKLQLDLCKEDSVGYHTIEALLFLKDLPPLKEPESPFNRNLLPDSPYAFFRDRVKKIIIDERANSDACPDQRLAYVAPYFRDEKKIWICPNSLNFGLVTFTSTLLHESRHVEGAVYDHRRCNGGIYAGEFSCDDTYADGGAYGVGLEYFVKLAHAKGIPAEAQASARRLAVMDFVQRFNEAPLDLQRGVLLRKENSDELFFFDGEKESPAGFSAPEGAILSSQGGLPLFFLPSTGKASLFLYGKELGAPATDVLTKRFEELSAEDRNNLLDVAYGDQLACLLLKNGLECFGPDREPFRVGLPAGTPQRLIFAHKSRVVPPGAIHLVMADGYFYQLPGTAAELKSSDPKTWPRTKAPIDLVALQTLDGTELGIDRAGKLVKQGGRKGTKRGPVPGLRSGYRDILAPFYRSKQLGDL